MTTEQSNKLIGTKKKARQQYMCMCCGGVINKGDYYDYSDGWSATSRNDIGESERKYWQFRYHLPNECREVDTGTEDEIIDYLF